MRTDLTAKQEEALEIVLDFYNATGAPPTVRQVAVRMNLRSSSTAYAHLVGLERKGYLKGNGKRGFLPVKERVA